MSNHPSRRRFLSTSAAAAAIGAGPGANVLSAQAPAPIAADEVTLALVNGRIHTSDANDTVVNTVVIRNGRFVAVGGAAPTAAATPAAPAAPVAAAPAAPTTSRRPAPRRRDIQA